MERRDSLAMKSHDGKYCCCLQSAESRLSLLTNFSCTKLPFNRRLDVLYTYRITNYLCPGGFSSFLYNTYLQNPPTCCARAKVIKIPPNTSKEPNGSMNNQIYCAVDLCLDYQT
jgi:hypothetical protein